MLRIGLIGVILCWLSAAWGQDLRKVSYPELTFRSAFEQAQFEAMRNGKPDGLGLLLAADSTATAPTFTSIKTKLDALAATVPVEKLAKKGEDKVVKYVFEAGHTSYLKRYQLNNYYTYIFASGQYNCVSASAFYYGLLEKLGIPAQIHETPDHIYVVAYPKTHKILLETTDPLLGFQPLSSKYAKKYIALFQAVKLVSDEETAGYAIDESPQQLWFADKEVTMTELAGIQYLNSGLYHYEAKQYRNALQEFKKSLYLYPDTRAQGMIPVCIAMILDEEGYHAGNIALLNDFMRYGEVKDPMDFAVGEFGAASYDVIIKGGSRDGIDSMYQVLKATLTDSLALAGIDFVYHYNKAVDLQNKGAYNQSQTHAVVAYGVKPLDEDLQAVIAHNLAMKHLSSSNFEAVAKEMENDLNQFSFLRDNYKFTGQLCMAYLGGAGTNFEIGNATKGNELIKRFEALYQENMVVDPSFIGMCYGAACGYYFKMGNNAKAKAMAKKGLEYAPNNYELKRRLKVLE